MEIRVAYITHASNMTGASQSLVDMLKALEGYPVKPFVFVRQRGPLLSVLDDMGVEWRLLEYHNVMKNLQGKRHHDVLKRVLRPAETNRLATAFEKLRIDIVHNNTMYIDLGVAAASACGVPSVCHMRELVEYEGAPYRFAFPVKTKEVISRSSVAIAISQAVGGRFSGWVAPGRLIVMPDALDTRQYLMEQRDIFQGDSCNMLLAGRIEPEKRQLDAIMAVKMLRDKGIAVSLTIIGSPSVSGKRYYDDCVAYVDENRLHGSVSFLDFQSDLRPHRGIADISLTCSIHEGLGRVTIEGMLAGCLAIGADASATPEIIEDGVNGLLYQAKSPEDLARTIEWAIKNPFEAREMAKRGRGMALDTYGLDAYARKLFDIYMSVLHRDDFDGEWLS